MNASNHLYMAPSSSLLLPNLIAEALGQLGPSLARPELKPVKKKKELFQSLATSLDPNITSEFEPSKVFLNRKVEKR